MEVTESVTIPFATAFFMQQGITLIHVDEGYKQMGSNAYKEEKA
jgi:hypothetical protein